ncbi:MAG: hypothetical protein AAF726_03065 [Planctomycetota bacterium]
MQSSQVLSLALALVTPAAAASSGAVADLRAAASNGGTMVLGDLPAFADGPLAEIEIHAPVVTESGDVLGEVGLGGARGRAVLHALRTGIDGDSGGWALAIDADAARLSDLVPPLQGTIADSLALRRTAVVLSTATARVDEAAMSDEVAAFYASYFDTPRMMLDVASGVNVLTRVESGDGTAVDRALSTLGVEIDGVVLQGTVLKDASLSELREAKDKGRLRERLRESMELRAYLPPVDLAGLPSSYATGEASLIVSGRPGVGVAFRLVAPGDTPETTKSFECRVDVAAGDHGATEVQVLGTAMGVWSDAFGIRGFDLTSPRLLLEVDSAQRVGFGVRAGLDVGSKEMQVAAKLKLHAVTGAIVGGFFEGSLDAVGSADLVALANAASEARGKEPISDVAVPDFELRDLYLKFAPAGGDSDLGVSDGYALRGELHALGSRFGFVDGAMSFGGLVPDIALAGECGDIDLGALALKDAAVDVQLGANLDQRFRVAGETRLFGLSRGVDFDCGLTKIWFDTWEELSGVYRVEHHVSSPGSGRPTWTLRSSMRNDFSRTLEDEVADHALAWAQEVERDFAAAQRDLDAAKREVERLDGSIEAARAQVRKERAAHGKGLERAQANVASIDSEIDRLRREVNAARSKTKDSVTAKKKTRDRAHSAWRKAVAARKKAKVWDKPKRKAAEAKAYADYQAKNADYGASKAAYSATVAVPVDADPRIAALLGSRSAALTALRSAESLVRTFPVDSDPRVAGQIAGRATALAALDVAKGAVDVTGTAVAGAGRVTSWAASHSGAVLGVDEAGYGAKLAGYLAGNEVDFRAQVRFLGEPESIRVRLAPAEIADGRVIDRVWSALRASLER